MKKWKLFISLIIVVLVIGSFAACGGGSTDTGSDGSATSEEPATSDEPAADDGAASTDTGAKDANAIDEELYAYLPDTCLSGFYNPNEIPDRTTVDKALPFEPKDKKNIVIGWTEITQSDAWFASVYDGAKAQAAKYGYTLNFDVAESDLQVQGQHMDSYISRGVDIIVIDPTDVVGVSADIQRAVDAGIPVLGFGSEIMDAPVITTVAGNAFENGFVNGQWVGENYYKPDEELTTGIIIGVLGNSTAESRVNGMLSGFVYGRAKAAGNEISKNEAVLTATKLFKEFIKNGSFESADYKFKCVAWGEGKWTEEGGLECAENIITTAGDDLDLIWAENDFQGSGAVKAIKNYGIEDKVKVATPANGTKEFADLIEEGIILTDGAWPGYQFATAAIDMIHDLAEGTNTWDPNNLPNLTAFTPMTYTKDNLKEFIPEDESDPFYLGPPLQILETPQLIEAVKNGTYGQTGN
ncbi:MAG: sugar ABC transporter substrate-binding protein [Clostridiales Family XIII bacterium]|jgi:ribose transport system substrate-binding protein|nr:sugar ABC transporter substrate-binding protein [Clostridiales Family XIII bacterium]